jgi:hypothetical protein
MKKFLLAASLSLTVLAANAQITKFQWAQGMGGTNNESGNTIAVDSAGNVYTAGNFSGTVTFDASNIIASKGNNDVFITKHDRTGTLVWTKQIGGVSDDLVRGIAVDKDYVYITGNYNQTCDFDPAGGTTLNLTSAGLGDIFVAKYETSSGNLVWAKSMGGLSADLGFGIAVDKNGNVYTTGNYAGACDFDPGAGTSALISVGGSDIFISKLDKDGNYEWAKSIGGINGDGGVGIAIDNTGNPIIGGTFTVTADFDPSAAISNLTSFGGSDIFVTKFNSMGLFQWAKQIGGTGSEYLEFLTTDKWGNIIYTARYDNNTDFDPSSGIFNITGSGKVAVARLNNNGAFVWAKKLGSVGTSERSKAVAVDTFGSVYTVGEFDGTQDFDPGSGTANLTSVGSTDVFVSKLDSAGNYKWAFNLGGTNSENGNGIAVGLDASVYTTGSYNGTCDFDPSTATANLTSAGSNDIFVQKMGQCIFQSGISKTGSTLSADMAGVMYQWVNYPSYTPISGATSQTYTPTTSGDYTVILTNAIGCKDTAEYFTVIGTSILEQAFGASIQLYPNPAQDFVTIDHLPNTGKISVVNLLGNVVLDMPISNSKMTIDTKELAKGIYFLHISNAANETSIKKLILN